MSSPVLDILLMFTALHVVCSYPYMDSDASGRVKREAGDGPKKVVCYYVNWSQYRPGMGRHTTDNIDPSLCTHVIFAFAEVDGVNLKTFEPNDIEAYGKLQQLKDVNPSLKTMLSVGGGTQRLDAFKQVAATPVQRETFSRNVVSYLRTHGFDGVDVDWEFPTADDRDDFTELIKALREEFTRDAVSTSRAALLLSCALGAATDTIIQGYNLPQLTQYLDFGNVMAYDLHGGWDKVTGFQAALNGYADFDTFNQKSVVQLYLTKGLEEDKLVLGIPTYGRTFTLCNPDNNGLRDCSNGHGAPGLYTRSNGVLAYYEICARLDDGWTREYSMDQQSAYAYNGSQWVGYDDRRSVQAKMEYIIKEKLAGAMFWDISQDDFAGICHEGSYPLVSKSWLINPGKPTTTTSPANAITTPATNITTPATIITTPATNPTIHATTKISTRKPATTTTTRATSTVPGKERPWWMAAPSSSVPTPASLSAVTVFHFLLFWIVFKLL